MLREEAEDPSLSESGEVGLAPGSSRALSQLTLTGKLFLVGGCAFLLLW